MVELLERTFTKITGRRDVLVKIGQNAKEAYWQLASATTEQKNKALIEAAKEIRSSANSIMDANEKDLALAKEAGKPASYLDRLALSPIRIEGIAKGIESVAELADPIGKKLAEWDRPNGLNISRVSVPLGVIGVIYEARPNVTADAAALCLKAGNAVILRCGSDSLQSSLAIEACIKKGLKISGLPEHAVQLIPTQDREAVTHMLNMTDYIDVIIPRGGRSLTEKIRDESKIPTFLHLDGNCHTYVHASANPKIAAEVIANAKMRRTGICGATESIVIDEACVDEILPQIVEKLAAENCEIRGDERAMSADSRIKIANPADWFKEYLDAIISVKTVANLAEAIEHVNTYSSHHTDAIISEDKAATAEYLHKIDSAIVMHNTSTQFADGGEFGMGAEIGIATGRMHARGPVGVEQLTTFKYIVEGNGQVRA